MPKMRSGFTLIQIAVGAVISGIAVFIISKAMLNVDSAFRRNLDTQSLDQEVMTLVRGLKMRLGESQGFQNLAFRVPLDSTLSIPDEPRFQSIGPGIYVQPDVFFDGTSSSDNDRLFFVSRANIPYTTLLANAVVGTVNPISMYCRNDVPPASCPNPTTYLQPNSYLVFSNGSQSELIELVSMVDPWPPSSYINATVNPLIRIGTDPAERRYDYNAGNGVFPATLNLLGVTSTGKLTLRDLKSGKETILAEDVTGLRITSDLQVSGVHCTTLPNSDFEYKRWWTTFNASLNGGCYQRIKTYETALTLNRISNKEPRLVTTRFVMKANL